MTTAHIFTSITARPTADLVCEQVEELIRSGALKPGEKLPAERDLARLLNVSRPVVRQAFGKLEMQRLVHTNYGGGTFVTNALGTQLVDPLVHILSNGENGAKEYLEYRREIEGAAAAWAAERATSFDREILELVFSDMERIHALNEDEKEAAADVQFHLAIVEAAHNNFFASISRAMYNVLWKNVRDSWTKICITEGTRRSLLEQHRAIKSAIVAGDVVSSKKNMQAHITFVIEQIEETSERLRREDEARGRLLSLRDRAET